MRCRVWTIVAVAALLLVGAPTALATGPGGNSGEYKDPFLDDGREDAPTLPDPVTPQRPAFLTDEIQLIGFSAMPVPGNRGILNMTLACQKSFAGSRICTAAEIQQSVYVPVPHNAAAYGSAWISSEGLSEVLAAAQSDCVGWTSSSNQDKGTAIAIGPEHGCYGGFVPTSCHHELLVACCAAPSAIYPEVKPPRRR